MAALDQFWQLSDSEKIATQKKFFELVELSKDEREVIRLKNFTYEPSVLELEVDSRRKIEKVTFEYVSFSKTEIIGLTFKDCNFNHCLFIGTEIRNCEFHNCKFTTTNTYKIRISTTYLDPASFDGCLDQKRHQNIGVHLYQMLLDNSSETRQVEFERDSHFLFMKWKRFQLGYECKRRDSRKLGNKYLKYVGLWIWEILFGCGLKFWRFAATACTTFTAFLVYNWHQRDLLGLTLQGEPIDSFSKTFYFTMVSFTTLGYGDIVPTTSWGYILASIQSLIGFFLLALLASMLFRKISP